MRIWRLVLGFLAMMMVSPAMAQDQAWVQIEAQPDLATAMTRARAYAAVFPQVHGFKLDSGWYGIALGPFGSDQAVEQLQGLMAQNMIPADSYISDGASYREPFWPAAGDQTGLMGENSDTAPVTTPPVTSEAIPDATLPETTAPEATVPEATVPDATAAVTPDAPAMGQPEETPAEARAAEAALTNGDKQDLQTALKWYGFYAGKVDGNIGSGSRASMASWQEAEGFEPTGVLTTAQRKQLVEGYRGEEAGFGFETLTDAESGIEITLPMAMLAFDRYTPPFARYAAKNGSGLTAMLISEPGTKASLAGLYNVLQTLDIMPAEGERSLGDRSFTIRGRNDKIETLAYAEVSGANVKGYVLSWNLALAGQMQRVLPMVQGGFRSSGDKALDPGLVPLEAAAKRGLLDGLSVKKAKLAQTGFFVDGKGSVLTAAAGLAQCKTITLDHGVEAKVSFTDKASGLAVLTPLVPLAPASFAAFVAEAPKVGAPISVSGYSYGGRLPAPVMTRGTLEEGSGLNGEAGLVRLSVQALPGDAGGPVLDASGAVVGMLLPADASAAKQLPAGVAFAATASALARVLGNPAGPALALNSAYVAGKASPDALNAGARAMTVLVSCWE